MSISINQDGSSTWCTNTPTPDFPKGRCQTTLNNGKTYEGSHSQALMQYEAERLKELGLDIKNDDTIKFSDGKIKNPNVAEPTNKTSIINKRNVILALPISLSLIHI